MMPTQMTNTNYGRLLHRLQASGLSADIQAILWYQGNQM